MDRGRIHLLLACLIALTVAGLTAPAAGAFVPSTGDADAVTTSSAVLHGVIDPSTSGSAWYFQYSSDRTMRSGLQKTASTPASTGLQVVQAMVSQLTPATSYYFQLVVQNPSGGPAPLRSMGAVHHFMTHATGTFGRVTLLSRTLTVSARRAAVPMGCGGRAPARCTAEITLSTKVGVPSRITCATGSADASAPHSMRPRLRLSGNCARLLSASSTKQLKATLSVAFEGGQATLVRHVTLVG